MSADQVLLAVEHLRIGFRRGQGEEPAEAVKGVSFAVPAGSAVALVGESGSGKSVTSLAIMGLLPEQAAVAPGSGIRFGGHDLLALDPRARRALCGREIGMIFQEPMSSLNPVFTVGFQIAEVLRRHLGLGRREARARTLALLEEVGIPEPARRIDAYPGQLSGGQQQRVMIAMAIACEPRLLIADEPTTALDVTIAAQIVELLADLQRRRAMAMLFITHDLGLVGEIADQVVVMRIGEIREQGPARQVLEHPRDAYTRALLACRPRLDRRPARLPVIDDVREGRAAAPELARRAPAAPLLVVRDLSKSFPVRAGWFGRGAFHALRGVSFELGRGRTLGVVGESGSGKSTLGLTLLRLHQASGGSVLVDGQDILALPPRAFHAWKRRLQIVFQNPYASLNPRFTVGQILLEPMRIHAIGADDAERVEQARLLLERVGLPAAALQR
jgi:peptide/nickel transport system ATP-binding protein